MQARTLIMQADLWRGRRVLLTGHTGFKGSWLALWLERLGAEVTGFAQAPVSEPSLFALAGVESVLDSRIGDLRDRVAVEATFEAARPEVVFHLAAQSLVHAGYADPVGTYGTNVMGTVHLLEAARRRPEVKAIVVVTSDKCYENREWVWPYRENDAMGGFDPYSSSKGCAELVTAAYRRSFFSAQGAAAVATARSGNVIGGGDWAADRLLPDVFRAVLAGEPVRIRSPRAIRPWQHVLDPLAGYLRLAEALWRDGAAHAEAWNFGPDAAAARPVGWILERLAARWGAELRWESDTGDHPHEAATLKLDASKARQVLGWCPRLDLETALEWVVEWYRTYRDGGDVRQLTVRQIGRYEELGR